MTGSSSCSSSTSAAAAATTCKEEGDRFFKAGRFHEATIHYTNAIDRLRSIANNNSNSNNIYKQLLCVCYSNRSACYLKLNSNSNISNSNALLALADADECARLRPDWFKSHCRRAECLLLLRRNEEAITAYERVLECDRNNTEAINALASARLRSNYNNNSSNNNNSGGGSHTSSSQQQQQQHQPNATNAATGAVNIGNVLRRVYALALTSWLSLSAETQRLLQLAVVGLLACWLFLPTHFYNYNSYSNYSNNYNSYSNYGSYGYEGGGYGLSWSQWGVVMLAAYKLPPLFPDLLGDFSRPFFGMNWTSFMWLLQLLTQSSYRGNRGAGMGFAGGFGRPRRHYY